MIARIFKVIFLVLTVTCIYQGILGYNFFYSQPHVINVATSERSTIPALKFAAQFTEEKDGLKNTAYITMIKDEDDVIYENLVWHFAVGFRKFIIFDNGSIDSTIPLIKRFAQETKGLATVILVDDPIVEHNQNKIITSGYRMAHEIWPEVKWFFPVDADEFWVFSQKPAKALAMIPDKVDAVSVIRAKYYPSDDYDFMPKDDKFWHKLHYRDSRWAEFDADRNKYVIIPKMFLRYSDHFSICIGNHHVIYHGPLSVKADENSPILYYNIVDDVRYGAADLYGIHLREYHMRSPEQTHKKFTNGLRAASQLKETKKNSLRAGQHWLYYQHYLDKAKNAAEAAKAKFKTYYRSSEIDSVIDDPLPIDDAIKLYKKLCDLKAD